MTHATTEAAATMNVRPSDEAETPPVRVGKTFHMFAPGLEQGVNFAQEDDQVALVVYPSLEDVIPAFTFRQRHSAADAIYLLRVTVLRRIDGADELAEAIGEIAAVESEVNRG